MSAAHRAVIKRCVEARLRCWVAACGLRLRRYDARRPCPPKRYSYTGSTIQVDWRPGAEERWALDVCHELGHWCAAAPERRGVSEWGLGQSPEAWTSASPPRTLSIEEAEDEELTASILGILLARELLGHEAALLDWEEHCWGCEPGAGWRGALDAIRRRPGAYRRVRALMEVQ